MSQCGGATITVSGGGSSAGLSNVATGVSDIGDSDVPASNAKTIDPSTLADHEVAIVVFAVAVNRQTGVTALTTKQIQDVFSGAVSNWSQLGGKNVPISLIERKPGSGTRLTFDKTVMRDRSEAGNPASTQDSTQLVLQQVAAAPGGVSYLAASSLGGSGLTAVSIDGATPTGEAVRDGSYGFFSHEHMYTSKNPPAIAASFIQYVLSEAVQGSLVSQLGYLPVSTTPRHSAADR
jgi:phosphate transport system substrate-binding protein